MLQDTVIQLYKNFKTVPVDNLHQVIYESMQKLIAENQDKKSEIINLFCDVIQQSSSKVAEQHLCIL